MNLIRCFCAFWILCGSVSAAAQTCSNTIPVTGAGTYTGNTCISTIQLPYLANGAIISGQQDIYSVPSLSIYYETFGLTADPSLGLSLFVCRTPCSTVATCVAIGDVNSNGIIDPEILINQPSEYFVVVGSATSCGSYSLSISAAFND